MNDLRIKNRTFVFIGLLFLLSCKAKYLSVDPVPKHTMIVSQELEYIIKTDQTDRKKGWFSIMTNNKKGKLIQQRDSIRGQRVYQLYTMNFFKTDEDKFNAGVVLIHSNDTTLRRTCYTIFEDLENNGETVGGRMNGKNWKKLVYQ